MKSNLSDSDMPGNVRFYSSYKKKNTPSNEKNKSKKKKIKPKILVLFSRGKAFQHYILEQGKNQLILTFIL